MTVKNLEESVEFYKNLFGFEVKKEQPDYKSKIIGNDQVKLCLYEDTQMKVELHILDFI
jgi:lactoylglutathione lyase